MPRLDHSGVCCDAIPLLEAGYQVQSIREVGIIGRAPKDFVRFHDRAYIAKKPVRTNSGFRECVTEYLISAVGRMLPLRVAEGRLVQLHNRNGETDVRFMSRHFLKQDEMLVHGVELVAECFSMDKSAVESELSNSVEERAFYTVDLVDEVLEHAARNNPDCHRRLRNSFARMLAFDALVGANDRHASNWGVIQDVSRQRAPCFSPVFDTARGLFLDRSDADLLLAEQRGKTSELVANYAARSRPLIGVPGNPNLNHFELIEYLVGPGDDKFGQAARQLVQASNPERVSRLLHYGFRRLFAPIRLRMIDRLLRYRWVRLTEICSKLAKVR